VTERAHAAKERTGFMQQSEHDIEYREVHKVFGTHPAVRGVSISIKRGELLTLLGPSGCGKTTLLRILAGFVRPTSGEVWLGGECINDIPPARRNVGLVFQNYSLFPHMTVFDNVAFGLQMRHMDKASIASRVEEVLELVHLADYARAFPSQLSGGMQQRIALARVVAIHPRALLLDEPFGAIDRRLRDEMQVEVRKIQQKLGITTLFVTHDQQEALIMSDRIVVMNEGRVEQEGLPLSIYDAPKTRFVAGFLGMDNIIPVRVLRVMGDCAKVRVAEGAELVVPVKGDLDGESATLAFRAECVSLGSCAEVRPPAPDEAATTVCLQGTVAFITNLGSRVLYEMRMAGGETVLAGAQRTDRFKEYAVGETLAVTLKGGNCVLFSHPGGEAEGRNARAQG
jgi:ABC-type Fe3+/spermidine/putrescine transport system ATPase subunit